MSIHPTAVVDKKAKLGKDVIVRAFAVIRADEGDVQIGDGSDIQEHVTVHGKGVSLGKNVVVGHNAVIHGAKIGSNVVVGMSSTILDGAEIGDWVIVGAGALVPPGKKIESGTLVMGVPAKPVRKLTEEDREVVRQTCRAYLEERE